MNKELSFAIIGGDERYTALSTLLPRVTDCAAGAGAVIFPVPFQWNDEIMLSLNPGQYIFAGYVSADNIEKAQALGLTIYDYCSGEVFTIENALTTAEGAIELAMRETKFTLASAKILIIGFGRIGKLLAHKLKMLSSSVSVYTRSETGKAWTKAYGYGVSDYHQTPAELSSYDIIFNTAPAMVLDAELLKSVRNALVIDLASKPGGIDYDAAAELKIHSIHALGLPGKVAPITSAMVIRDEIVRIMRTLS